MTQVYRVLLLLVGAAVVVPATAAAAVVAGLNRWVVSEGRIGVADPSAMRSSDHDFHDSDDSLGILDKLIVRTADDWLDVGVGLTIHRVVETAVAPALALLLFVVAFLSRVRHAATWAGVILFAVAFRALLGLPGDVPPAFHAAAMVAGFGVVAIVLYRLGWLAEPADTANPADAANPAEPAGRAVLGYRALALVLAVAVALQAAALAYAVSGLNWFLTEGRGGYVWASMLDSLHWLDEGVGLTVFLWAEFVVIPALALLLLLAAFRSRSRTAVVGAVALLVIVAVRAGLALAGAENPGPAAAYALVTFALFAFALSPRALAGRLDHYLPTPSGAGSGTPQR